MFTLKEAMSILIATIVFTFVITFNKIFQKGGLTLEFALVALLIAFAILMINIITKKIIAKTMDSSIEHKILEWQRWGFYERSYTKYPIPIGVLLPFVIAVLFQGYFYVLVFLKFDVAPSLGRVRKAVGLYRFSDMTENQEGWIAGWGIILTLIAAVAGYLIGGQYFLMFSRISIYYAFWNIIPISKLDGAKLFFGSLIGWEIIASICLIALGYAFFLI